MIDGTTMLELAVIGAAGLTLVFSVWSLYVSHMDRVALVQLHQNGIKQLTVRARLVRDIARVSVSIVLLFSAGWCVYLPPDRDLAAMVMKVALLLIASMLGTAVLVDFHWRKRIDLVLATMEEYQDTHSPDWK